MAIPTVALLNSSITPIILLASNSKRSEAIIQNSSTSPLYISLGDTASQSRFSVKLYTDDVLTTQFNGTISGIWGAATGSASVTEIS